MTYLNEGNGSRLATVGTHASLNGRVEYRLLESDAIQLLEGLKPRYADAIITDIPYGEVNDRPSNGIREWDVGSQDVVNFDLEELARLSYDRTRGWVFVFCGWGQFSTLIKSFKALEASVRWLPWIKTNPSPWTAQAGVPTHEVCVVARRDGATLNEDYALQALLAGTARRKVNGIKALKSSRLMAHLVRLSTEPGDLVVDPFMGIGTTGEAAVQLGRHFLGSDHGRDMVEAATQHLEDLKPAATHAQLQERYPPLPVKAVGADSAA